MRVFVSACLLGRACRYDGAARPSAAARALAERVRRAGGVVVEGCPEEGLGVPRPPAELSGGDGHAVLDGRARVLRVDDRADVTTAFLDGARACAEAAGGADLAVLKARSPSCGVGRTHVDGAVREGDGVLAALLRRRGVRVVTDEELDEEGARRGAGGPGTS